MMTVNTIIWDLGGVLIDWNPRYVFNETYFGTEEKREYFFKHICSNDWNEEQDAGRSIVEATQELVKQFPEWESAIRDYYGRWTEMLKGPVHETVDLFRQYRKHLGTIRYALLREGQNLVVPERVIATGVCSLRPAATRPAAMA